VTPGDAVTLSWNAPTATSITIDNGIGSVAPPSGSISVTPQTTTRYTATALDPQGNTSTNSALVVVSSAGHGFVNIRHIIFFVQENRSFDNYFGQMGQYRAQQGYTDPFDGLPPNASQPDASGITVPSFHLGTVCVENTDPGWLSAWDDYDNGQMDHFVIEAGKLTQKYFANSPDPNGTRAMGYYDSTDLPYYYALAFQFATSDRFFSPVLTGTIPNRMYLFAGSSFGYIYPPNSTSIGQFKQPTIFDRLDQAGISWRYYYQDDTVFLSQWSTWSKDSGKVWNISHWYSDVQNEATLPQVIFIERASHLHLDEHPGGTYSNIQLGAANTQRIFSALMQSPSWPSSLLILTYDEFGGLYDHVPPAPMPAPDNIPPPSGFGGDFRHSGFRVPVIVISPWIKPHFVSHVTRDYTSILKLIETRFGVRSLTARDAAADDMTEFLDFSQPHWGQPPVLPAQPTNGTCTLQDEKAPEF
jgi:phospholipase C